MTEKRRFQGAPAVRASVPLWIGLYGPSGSGKTYSALRLARGIQSVVGGEIGGGCTENGRICHYASEYKFRYYRFDPPFDPLSYLDLLEQMARDGITVAIVDSGSHEHEGEGGVLDMHEAEIQRMLASGSKKKTRESVQMLAWSRPKQERRRMINAATRLPLHVIWCFRAREKLEVRRGEEPKKLGFMPIGAEELVYEMALTALLLPGARGEPTWSSAEQGERQMIKLPHYLRDKIKSGPLSEETGAALARWAQGADAPRQPAQAQGAGDDAVQALMVAYEGCETWEQYEGCEAHRAALWGSASSADRKRLKAASDEARAGLPSRDPGADG